MALMLSSCVLVLVVFAMSDFPAQHTADILVVDDIPHNLRLLSRMLDMQGYHVRCTTSPRMALQAAKTEPPDLLLLDVKMPQMSGYDLCQLLKQDEVTQSIPVIFISALDELADKLRGFEVGGVDYVTKPFHEAEILMRVRTQIMIQQQRKQLVDQNQKLTQEIAKRQQTEVSLQASEEQYRNLVEQTSDWIWECDANWRVTYTNGQLKSTLGRCPTDVLGRSFHDILTADSYERFVQILRQLTSDRPSTQLEVGAWHQSGTVVEFETSGLLRLSPQGHVLGYRGIARDISRRKQVEHEIRQALGRQKEINEFKSRFVSVISHEFRTPLTVIHSSADILQNIPCDEREREELLMRIQAAVNHMTLLVDDVVLVGQAETGKLKSVPTRVTITPFLQDLLREFEVLTQPNHQIKFISEVADLELSVDQKLLRQMVTNLVSNAIKYSPAGGDVTIHVARQGSNVVLEISDSGIGIPLDDQTNLFECFHRAQNVGTIPGTGIGLFITRECARLHQGDITVRSEVGQGTTFTVRLPLALDMDDPADDLV
jgi:PAS domain S-box-containing protein